MNTSAALVYLFAVSRPLRMAKSLEGVVSEISLGPRAMFSSPENFVCCVVSEKWVVSSRCIEYLFVAWTAARPGLSSPRVSKKI